MVSRHIGQNGSEDTTIWTPEIQEEIIRVAVDTVGNADAASQLVAQACCILTHGAELYADQRTSVLKSLANRLSIACTSQDKLTEMVEISMYFREFCFPQSGSEKEFTSVGMQILAERGPATS